jgi:hypothetical protein
LGNDLLLFYFSFHLYLAILICYLLPQLLLKLESYKLLLFIIGFSIISQSIIAIFQFSLQSNLGLHFLGETIFNPETLGVAKFTLNQTMVVRAYGTFLHPNTLAAFFLISALIIHFLNFTKKWKYIFYSFIALGMLATVSRIGIITLTLFFIIIYYRNLKKIKPIFYYLSISLLSILSIIYAPIILERFSHGFMDESLQLRVYYYLSFFNIIKDHFLFGMNSLNFVSYFNATNTTILYPWEYQFVHNTFVLFITIFGLTGTVIVIELIYLSNKKILSWVLKPNLIFIPFFIFACFEHNFITSLPILIWLGLALGISSLKPPPQM